MKEYKPLYDGDLVYLIPVGESPPSHVILVENASDAHDLKLSLGLGKRPDPTRNPGIYTLHHERYGEAPIYKVNPNASASSTQIRPKDDWKEPGCCESGCKGCEWTKRNMPDRY